MNSKILYLILILIIRTSICDWELDTNLSLNGNTLEYINIVDSSVIWILGDYPGTDSCLVARRTNNGLWVVFSPFEIFGNRVKCIAAVDSSNAFIGTANGKVFSTTNGGINWQLILNAGGQSFVNDIRFSRQNKNYGYIFCDPPLGVNNNFTIYKTSNFGLSWTENTVFMGNNYLGNYKSCSITDSNHAWFGLYCVPSNCYSPKIAYTTNGGFNWNTMFLTTSGSSYYVSAIDFQNNNQDGIAGNNNNPLKLYKTTNNSFWNQMDSLYGPNEFNSIVWVDSTSVWFYSTYNRIAKSTNNGISWQNMSMPVLNDEITHLDAINGGNYIYTWSITLNGKILKLRDSLNTIGIISFSQENPIRFELFHAFPNPFNLSTTIKFSLQKSETVNFKIFDILGKEVETIINNILMEAGKYEIDWEPINLPSGVYFYRIEAGNFNQANKIVLIK